MELVFLHPEWEAESTVIVPVSHKNRLVLIASLVLLPTFTLNCRTGGDDTVPTRDIKTVMEAHAAEIMSIAGVAAVAIGELPDGTPCIKVYVVEKSEAIVKKIPDRLEGHPIVIEESGEIKPMQGS